MANKRPNPEGIVSKLRQVDVLMGQGISRLDATLSLSLLTSTKYDIQPRVTAGMPRISAETAFWVFTPFQGLRYDFSLGKLWPGKGTARPEPDPHPQKP